MTTVKDIAATYWEHYLSAPNRHNTEEARKHAMSAAIFELAKYLEILGKDTAAAELRALLSEEFLKVYQAWQFEDDVQDEDEPDQYIDQGELALEAAE
jgi:hypothetical protein